MKMNQTKYSMISMGFIMINSKTKQDMNRLDELEIITNNIVRELSGRLDSRRFSTDAKIDFIIETSKTLEKYKLEKEELLKETKQ